MQVPPGWTFLAFTDGLIERRGESIEIGFERLANAAIGDHGTLDNLLSDLVAQMAHHGSEDDIAVLAFRWSDTIGPSVSFRRQSSK
jgi:serine phosphatase RsbU (regulator of sigma subunit)